MKLILIHGAPATGKLTVAKALASLRQIPLVDNHAAIDMARMVFGFAQPGFWDLVHDLRVTTLKGAARAGVPALIMTSAYSAPADDALLRDYKASIDPYGGTLWPVFLHCREETMMSRVTALDRAQRGKIATPDTLKAGMERNNFVAMPVENCLSLSTEVNAPEETARQISARLGLPTRI